jgi:hypothetical protein
MPPFFQVAPWPDATPGGSDLVAALARHDYHGAVGLVQQGVRHAADRGADPAETTGSHDDLLGVAGLGRSGDRFRGRSLDKVRLDSGPGAELLLELGE